MGTYHGILREPDGLAAPSLGHRSGKLPKSCWLGRVSVVETTVRQHDLSICHAIAQDSYYYPYSARSSFVRAAQAVRRGRIPVCHGARRGGPCKCRCRQRDHQRQCRPTRPSEQGPTPTTAATGLSGAAEGGTAPILGATSGSLRHMKKLFSFSMSAGDLRQ